MVLGVPVRAHDGGMKEYMRLSVLLGLSLAEVMYIDIMTDLDRQYGTCTMCRIGRL